MNSMMNDVRNDEFKSRGRVNSRVRWRAELSLMLIRNPNMEAHVLVGNHRRPMDSHLVRAHICAAVRSGVCVRANPCANPVAPTPSDAIDRAVVAWMLRSRT